MIRLATLPWQNKWEGWWFCRGCLPGDGNMLLFAWLPRRGNQTSTRKVMSFQGRNGSDGGLHISLRQKYIRYWNLK